ncbi:MAG: E2/UBC family protein [Gemmatimonadota bacterium]
MSVAAAMGLIEAQLDALATVFPGASAAARPDGTVLVTIPTIPLSAAWSVRTTAVQFLVPVAYPMAQPDCFWAAPDLRLVPGTMPMNTNLTPIPGESAPQLWFSWHVARWNPVTDTLLTFARVIQARLSCDK